MCLLYVLLEMIERVGARDARANPLKHLCTVIANLNLVRWWSSRRTLASPAVGHWGTCPLPLSTSNKNLFFQLTLELHKVWQRLCVTASPNIFIHCIIACYTRQTIFM